MSNLRHKELSPVKDIYKGPKGNDDMGLNNRNEKLLSEAIRNYLSQDAKLGLKTHKDVKETSHTSCFQWEGIDDMFALKASKSPFFENLTGAFNSVHSYKYIDSPTFITTLVNELKSHGVPAKELQSAVKYVREIIEELGGEKVEHKHSLDGTPPQYVPFDNEIKDWAERDAGWNPNIEEINDMTRNADDRKAKTEKPFTGGGPAPKKDEIEKGFKQ